MTLALLVLQFAVCAALIGRAGYVLSLSADRIARATGLTGGWIGLALLATVTSLPELASGISAVAVIEAPNLAVGNALGACVFNLLFLAIIDALQRKQPIYRSASSAHLLSAASWPWTTSSTAAARCWPTPRRCMPAPRWRPS